MSKQNNTQNQDQKRENTRSTNTVPARTEQKTSRSEQR